MTEGTNKMDSISIDPAGRNLTIEGKRFRLSSHGDFSVPVGLIRSRDLSVLPISTNISINWRGFRVQPGSEIISVVVINVMNSGTARVDVHYSRCNCCWQHALDYMKYNVIAETLFGALSGTNNFQYSGMFRDKEGKILHGLNLDVNNGVFDDIEKQVIAFVMPVLKPLLDHRDSLDALTLKQFGV